MDQIEFRKLKEAGQLPSDADLAGAETEIVPDDRYEEPPVEEEVEEEQEQPQDEPEAAESDEEPGEEELSPREKTAFEKRLERERAKERERIRAELEQENEQKYGKYREAVEAIGGDPEKILAAAREAKLQREAQTLAERNGWDDEQTQWYIEQTKQQQELKELRVQMQINRLKDHSDYAGIASMEKDIMAKIDRSNGALSVEEAFWALGGPKRVEQVKLEAQQREVARRAQAPRTVVKDSPSTNVGEKPLPPEVIRDAKQMGISLEEARRLHNTQAAGDIDAWREQRKKAQAK